MRGLAAQDAPEPGADLRLAVAEALDRRLAPRAPWPVAVALSGGGDSLALLLTAADWARARGRSLLVLTVDHRLQAASAAWTAACAATAARLGADFQALAWEGAKPQAGLASAARDARHRLLAEAARAACARVILMGHTADDVAEAALMRDEGSTTPAPRAWAPSPAWPQGRGLFLLRPLLGCRRAELRAWLAAHGETWIDDPANEDPRQARARARLRLPSATPMACDPPSPPDAAGLALATRADAAGVLSLSRRVLREATFEAASRFAAMACLSASGATRPPRGERLARLAHALQGRTSLIATLAGARVEADATEVRFLREAGEAARGGLPEIALPEGEAVVWDGRFEITADRADLRLRRLAGIARRLGGGDRAALQRLAPAARAGAPAILTAAGEAACPILSPMAGVTVRSLALQRLLAACGAVDREPGPT